MNTVSTALSPARSGTYQAIFWAGLLTGTLALTAACVTNGLRGRSPIWVMQSVASGLLGANTYKGGFSTAALGVMLHFLIATTAAAVYYLASRQLKLLVKRAIGCGLAYGIAVFLFMNLAVIPLSAIGHRIAYSPTALVSSLIVHMLFVGLPIALTVRWYSK